MCPLSKSNFVEMVFDRNETGYGTIHKECNVNLAQIWAIQILSRLSTARGAIFEVLPGRSCMIWMTVTSESDLLSPHKVYHWVNELTGLLLLHVSVPNKNFFPWSCLVLFCITIFSTKKENSRVVPNFGNFRKWNTKFQIREFPFHFRDWDGTGNGQSRKAGLRHDGK